MSAQMPGASPDPNQGSSPSVSPTLKGAPDDVDRVFARLAPLPPPRGFAQATLLAARAARPPRVTPLWLAGAFTAIVAVLLLAYLAGGALVGGGFFELAAVLRADSGLLFALPGDTLLAMADVVPWLELMGILVALAGLAGGLRRLSQRHLPRAETAATG